jgi:outer membrane receptor protein involved in Fe transport
MHAQYTVSGKVTNVSNQGIEGVEVLIAGSTVGTITNIDGSFSIETTDNKDYTILFFEPAYESQSRNVSAENPILLIVLKKTDVFLDEIVISSKRQKEILFQSPISIQKVSSGFIQKSSSGDLYQELDHLKELHFIDNSFGFKIFNTRGFNSTSGFRVVNFVDGMDNMSVGINFAPGSLFGVSELDIENVEIISGPASALYGPNALQGVMSINTRNPIDNPGFGAELKIGNREYLRTNFWFGERMGKKERFGLKVDVSYFKAKDFPANNPDANRYRTVPSPPINLNAIAAGIPTNQDLPQMVRSLYSDFNIYTSNNPSVLPNIIPPGTQFLTPAYEENDLFNQNASSLKIGTGLYYRIKDNVEVSYLMRYSKADGVYQGNNRAVFKNFEFWQNRLQIGNDKWMIRYYNNIDKSIDSYDLVLTGILMGFAGLEIHAQDYLNAYVQSVSEQTNGFLNAPNADTKTNAIQAANAASVNSWLQPGTPEFQAAFDKVTTDPSRPFGSAYTDLSRLHHVEGQYNFDLDFMDALIGVSFRRFDPRSNGTLFLDTMGRDISFHEYGGYMQIGKKLLDKVDLLASFRLDKSENFNLQFSWRTAATYTNKNHSLRVLAQSAFRSPTLNDQYFNLNTGSFIVIGNLEGFPNVYTQTSVDAFLNSGPPNARDESLLQVISIAAVKPEKLTGVEAGYRGILANKILMDVNYYFNIYKNFIGAVRAVDTKNEGGTAEAIVDLNTRNYQAYSISSNSTSRVKSTGGSIGITYKANKAIDLYSNYTFCKFLDEDNDDPLIPSFNTPTHKFNVGIKGEKVWKGFGFGINFKWVDSYLWQERFASGLVPSYHTLDASIHYTVDRISTTFKIGGSNLYDNDHFEAFGAATIGGFYYGSITYNVFRDKIKE